MLCVWIPTVSCSFGFGLLSWSFYPSVFFHNTWIIPCVICVWPEAAKEEEAEDDDDMDGFQTDDDNGDGSDKEMGVDAEDGDEADSIRLQKLAAQVCVLFWSFRFTICYFASILNIRFGKNWKATPLTGT